MLSSSFIRNIIFEIVADIEIGPESSDETVPLSIVLNKGFGCVFLVTLSRRDESLIILAKLRAGGTFSR